MLPLLAITAVSVGFALGMANPDIYDLIIYLIILLMFAGIFLILVPKLNKIQYRSVFKSQKTLQEEITINCDNNGIQFSANSGMFQTNWSDILRYKRGQGLILIYEGKHLFRMIPERMFSEPELHSILEYLERAK
ncbi:MAG: YcxB family protein [Cyanobacteria bacterium P01_D01_bin.123]